MKTHPLSSLRRFALVIPLLLSLVVGCSAGSSTSNDTSDSSASTSVTIGLTYTPDIQFAPFYVAVDKGYFADEGLSVELRHHGSSESLTGALEAGTEDVVYAGGDEMMVARSQGVDVVDFATLYQDYPAELIVPADSPITTLADLRGHSIGVPGEYGETWYALLALLDQAGLTRDDVDIQTIGFTQQAALSTNKVDAVIGFSNNDAVKFKLSGMDIREIPLSSDIPLVSLGLGGSQAFVSDHPDELAAMVRALEKAVEYCTTNPDDTISISQEYIPGLDADAARQILQATEPLYGDDFGAQNDQAWSDMAQFLLDKQIITDPVEASDSYTTLSD